MTKSDKSLLIASIIFSLILLELGLRVMTVFPVNYESSKISDELLVYKMDPARDDIDENGFRNTPSDEPVKIVAIGDSHTYGNNVKGSDAWPQQLSRMVNKRVYNFGVGSYGLHQYRYLIDDAIRLNPEHIILAMFLANDLNNACGLMRQDYWITLARSNQINYEICSKPAGSNNTRKLDEDELSLASYTAIGSAYKFMVREPLKFYYVALMKVLGMESGALNWNDGRNNTLIGLNGLVKRYNCCTDLNNAEVILGLQLVKAMLVDAKTRADKKKIKFSVLFVPSKHRIYYNHLLDAHYYMPAVYHNFVASELLLTNEISAVLTDARIPFIEAAPYVEKEFNDNGQVYTITTDNHPTATGYRAYAKGAAELIPRQ